MHGSMRARGCDSPGLLDPDLRAVEVRPTVDWTIYLASAEQSVISPASAKLAELLLASAGGPSTS